MKVPKLLGASGQKYLGSSQNPEDLSVTVQGVAVALLPALTLVLSAFGVNADWLKEAVTALVGLAGAGLTFYGVLRKFKRAS